MYPDNMVDVRVRMYLYRWNDRAADEKGATVPYEVGFCPFSQLP